MTESHCDRHGAWIIRHHAAIDVSLVEGKIVGAAALLSATSTTNSSK